MMQKFAELILTDINNNEEKKKRFFDLTFISTASSKRWQPVVLNGTTEAYVNGHASSSDKSKWIKSMIKCTEWGENSFRICYK